MRLIKSLFLLSLLLISTSSVVFAGPEFEWSLSDKTMVVGETTDLYNMGTHSTCYEDDSWGTFGNDDCDLETVLSSNGNVANCNKNGEKVRCEGLSAGSTTVTVKVSASDTQIGYDTQSFTLTVTQNNRAPTATDIALDVEEGDGGDNEGIITLSKSTFEAAFNDPDVGDSLSKIQINELPEIGTLKINNVPVTKDRIISDFSNFKYEITSETANIDNFKFYVFDSSGTKSDNVGEVEINILVVNDAPIFSDLGSGTFNEYDTDETVIVNIMIQGRDMTGGDYCNDVDNIINEGSFYDFNFFGSTDNSNTDGEFLEIYLVDQGEDENQGKIADCSVYLDNLHYNNIDAYRLKCNSIKDKFGTNIITLGCKDPEGAESRSTYTLNILNTNDFPVEKNNIVQSVSSGGIREIKIPVEDADGDTLTYTLGESVGEITLSNTDNHIIADYSSENLERFEGEDIINIFVTDGNGGSLSIDMTIDVGVANDPPTLSPIPITISEGESYTFKASDFSTKFRDQDSFDTMNQFAGINIELALASLNDGGILTYNGVQITGTEEISKENINKLIYTPNSHFVGTETFEVRAKDNGGLFSSDTVIVTMTVQNVADQPTFLSIFSNEETNEDINWSGTIYAEDPDGDITRVTAFPISGSDVIDKIEITEVGLGVWGIIIAPFENAFGDVDIKLEVIDNTLPIKLKSTQEFKLTVNSINDKPVSQNSTVSTEIGMPLTFSSSAFPFVDVEDEIITAVKIYNTVDVGRLLFQGTPVTQTELEIGSNGISSLVYSPLVEERNTSLRFQVKDSNGEYSGVHTLNITIAPSPYGPNSHPARLGGNTILNSDWACKPGFNLKTKFTTLQMIFESTEDACEQMVNTLPIANISISVERAPFGSAIFFSGAGSVDEEGPILEYIWELSPSITKNGSPVSHIYTSETDCPLSGCSIKLTVIDTNGENSTATKILTLGGTETTPDYSSLIMIKGQDYADDELAYLGLNKGQMNFRNGQEITVDSNGKITQIVKYEGDPPEKGSYMVGDGICSKSLGEHSSNSPDDCEGDSKMGAVLLLAFLTILGGGTFFAWKKGLLGKHNLSLGAKPAANASSVETRQPVQPSGPEQYIKTQRSKGFSNEQIRGALKNKGWKDDKIDEALNASRK